MQVVLYTAPRGNIHFVGNRYHLRDNSPAGGNTVSGAKGHHFLICAASYKWLAKALYIHEHSCSSSMQPTLSKNISPMWGIFYL